MKVSDWLLQDKMQDFRTAIHKFYIGCILMNIHYKVLLQFVLFSLLLLLLLLPFVCFNIALVIMLRLIYRKNTACYSICVCLMHHRLPKNNLFKFYEKYGKEIRCPNI